MFKKKKGQRQETWSIDMLEQFKDHLVNSVIPYICFVLRGGLTSISLKKMSEKHHTYFLGELAGFEGVYFGINPLASSTEEYRDCLGYIEILNGNSEESEPVPVIRGFIKENSTFFESFSKMAIESKLLSPNELMVGLTIHFDPSTIRDLRNIPAGNILNMKLPIESIDMNQRISFARDLTKKET